MRLILKTFVMLVLAGVVFSGVKAEEKLVGYWPLEDFPVKNVKDESGNRHNGTSNAFSVADKSGQSRALELNGRLDSFITIPFSPSFNIEDELTLEAWIYPYEETDSSIISKGRSHWACGYHLVQRRRKLAFLMCSENAVPKDRPLADKVISDTDVLEKNKWSHVACVYSVKSDKVVLYHNGEKIKETKAFGKISHHLYPKVPLRFGVDSFATGYYKYSGVLRNVRVYASALSDDEVKRDYEKDSAIKNIQVVPFETALKEKYTSKIGLSIRDADSKEKINARIYIKTKDNVYIFPGKNILTKFGSIRGGFFYNDGDFEVNVPPGDIEIGILRGLEFRYEKIKLALKDNEHKQLDILLHRFIDMSASGWYACDPHLHYIHYYTDYGSPELVSLKRASEICRAEGLNFAGFQCGLKDRKDRNTFNTKDFILSLGYEYRNDAAAHFTWLNPRANQYPTVTDNFDCIAQIDEVEKDGGILYYNDISALNSEITNMSSHGYSRELPITASMSKMPVAEIFCGDRISFESHELRDLYRYLNCGIKMAVASSTDTGVYGNAGGHSLSPGVIRTYVKADVLSVSGIVNGFRQGATFVTEGPLLDFKIAGKDIGDVVEIPEEQKKYLDCGIKASSIFGIRRCELVKNGEIIKVISPESGKTEIDISFKLEVDNSCWFAVRCYGDTDKDAFPWSKKQLKAHSSPIYVQFGNRGIVPPKDDVDYFLGWLGKCREFGKNWATLNKDDGTRLARYLDLIDKSESFYKALLLKPRAWTIQKKKDDSFVMIHASDSHISAAKPQFGRNFDTAISFINRIKPDIVVLTGDLADRPTFENFKLFKTYLGKIKVPYAILPGNHDIGNKKGLDEQANSSSLKFYRAALGEDCWHLKLNGGIHLIGINSLIVNSGLPEEKKQFAWLVKELEAIPAGETKILLCHEPMLPEKKGSDPYFFIDQPGANELMAIVDKYKINGILCGHMHKPYKTYAGECLFAVAPALSFSLTGNKDDTGVNVIKISGTSIRIETVTLKEMPDFKIR